jgi:signal transduction histidine kinase
MGDDATAAKLWELTRLTRSLATTLDYDRALGAVVEAAGRLLETPAAALLLEEADGLARVAASTGVEEARVRAFAEPLDERIGQRLTALFGAGSSARLLAVPLMDHAAIRGVLAVCCPAAGLGPVRDEEMLLSALADHASIALRNARHVGRLASDVKRASAAEQLLMETATLLASSLDYQATLRHVARLVVSVLADRCLIDLIEPDGTIRRAAVSDADPSRAELAERLYQFTPSLDGKHPVARVLRSGLPVSVSGITPEMLAEFARGPEHLELIRELGLTACLGVPLSARGRTIGCLLLASREPGRVYGDAELGLAHDLARRVAVAVDNAWLYAEAREAVHARDAFLARASHELRTPLTSALGTVRLMRRALAGELRQRPDELLDIATRSLESMAVLVNDLLDVARLTAGGDQLASRPVALAEIAARALAIVRPQAEERRVTFAPALPEGLVVDVDPHRFEQVLVNLLANAVKFTPAAGTVSLSAAVDERQLLVSVRDTGEGILRHHIEAIFQPFFRSAHPAPGRAHGTGLGLSICRHIVTQHGGHIWAESAGPGQGSTFLVALPVSRVSWPARQSA